MIGVCGFGHTGSGAVTDLLKEYKNVQVQSKKEFVLTYFPDGFEDLEYHLMKQRAKFFSSDIAILRFKKYMHAICHNEKSYYYKITNGNFKNIIDKYIQEIIQISWQGSWMYDDYIFDSFYKKLKYVILKNISFLNKYSQRTINYSIEPEKFYSATEKTLQEIYNYNNYKGLIILDQPFPANNPINSMNLYGKDTKAIIVLRDPRDLYIQFKRTPKERFVPKDDINSFIQYFSKMYKQIKKDNRILYVQFEDLIYNYDKTVNKICKFCGIDEKDHIDKYKYLDPKKSIKNTKLYVNCKEYESDIKMIEKYMSEYLYD